jgi:AcrR family transcriptional regulator
MGDLLTTPSEPTKRAKRSDGERSRAAILDAAAKLATLEGLDGLSIGGLADHIGMSKSGLYAHFGSKEELQLATIDTASAIVVREVIEPAREQTGLARVQALVENFLSYLERQVFPGGCFFDAAAGELDTHPGPVRDKLMEAKTSWIRYLERTIEGAQERGELDPEEEPAQLAFELDALLQLANRMFVLHGDAGAFERARRGIQRRLAAAAAE